MTRSLQRVSLFNKRSSDTPYPHLLAVFLSVRGVPAAGIGRVGDLADTAASVLTTVSGWLSDRVPRRRPQAFSATGVPH
jgi:hypothetical protein